VVFNLKEEGKLLLFRKAYLKDGQTRYMHYFMVNFDGELVECVLRPVNMNDGYKLLKSGFMNSGKCDNNKPGTLDLVVNKDEKSIKARGYDSKGNPFLVLLEASRGQDQIYLNHVFS
jgi:hypothetical protein